MATVIKADGTREEVTLNAKDTLGDLQQRVGGHIQILPFRDGTGRLMVIHEEGKFMGFPINQEATVIAWKLIGIARDDFIVGDILICEDGEVD